MKHTFTTKALSLLLTLVMLLGMLPAAALAAEEGPSDAAVSALTELYSGDENRARSDLEAMYASGLIDESGSMVALDIREDGASVELAALTQRIAAGEDVGAITVNGNAATPEQIVKISQVKAALEIAELLDEDIDVTDEHVENLESLLTGIQNGNVDLENALKTGALSLKSTAKAQLLGAGNNGENALTISDDGKHYIGRYVSGSESDATYEFDLDTPDDTSYYTDPQYSGYVGGSNAATTAGTISFSFPSINHDKENYSTGYLQINYNKYYLYPITVTATLDQAQPYPVSFDWKFSGGNNSTTTPGGTVTWKAGESGDKTFDLFFDCPNTVQNHIGKAGYQFNASNISNALFEGGKKTYTRNITALNFYLLNGLDTEGGYYFNETKSSLYGGTFPTSVAFEGVYSAAGTYYPGEILPVTVIFDKPVAVDENTTITVNGSTCNIICGTDTESKDITFGYVVKENDAAQLNVTAVSGFKTSRFANPAKGNMTVNNFTEQSITPEKDQVYIGNYVKTESLDLENAVYGIDDGKPGSQIVTVLIPLRDTRWLNTEMTAFREQMQVELPGYGGKQTIANYLSGTYFSYDKGATRYPAYVVEADDKPAIYTRFVAPANTESKVRMDTVELYMDTQPVAGTSTDYLPEIGEIQESNGFFYFSGSGKSEAHIVPNGAFSYLVKAAFYFDSTAYATRTQTYETAEKGFIKLTVPEDADFPYLYPGDPEHPENQYDVEMLVTAEFYEAFKEGVVYTDSDDDYRFSYQISSRKHFSFVDPDSFTFHNAEKDGTKPGTAIATMPTVADSMSYDDWYITVENGGGDKQYDMPKMPAITVQAGLMPFLTIPRSSRVRETLTGIDTDVFMATNISEQNKISTVFHASLYKITEDQILQEIPDSATPLAVDGWGEYNGTPDNPVTAIKVPGTALDEAGAYAVKISVEFNDGRMEENKTFTATAYLKVKQGPATVKFNSLESYYVSSGEIPAIGYSLHSAANDATVYYTVQKSGSNDITSMDGIAAGGNINYTFAKPEGLKDAYTITVYAHNKETDPWSVDSMLLTVYNTDVLELIVKEVAKGTIGGTTGGTGDSATETTMDNTAKITGMVGAGSPVVNYTESYDSFQALRADIGLQKVISANYGSGVWGAISDRMEWKSADRSKLNVKYEQGGFYSDIENYSYTSYSPASDFLLVGTEDADSVKVTAKHAKTGMTADVTVKIDTLKNELYMFQFYPKAATTIVYTNGKGDRRELTSGEDGTLVVYEPDGGIGSNVSALSKTEDGVTYVGTIYKDDLVSGEKDIASLQLYPCNNLVMHEISKVELTFIEPDGKRYSGNITFRAGVYKNGIYCPTALIKTSVDPDSGKNGREDVSVTAEAGKVKLWFDPTQFKCTNEDDNLGADDTVSYVFEYRFAAEQNYQPGYVIINPASNDPADSIVNLHTVSGSRTSPQIVRQDYQQYLNGTKATDYKRNVIDSTENIGISTNFSKAVLYTVIALPGENVTVGEQVGGNRGYSIYENTDAIKFALYPTVEGKAKLTGQTDISSDNVTAAQITNLSQINDETTYFVFPFSSMPMLRSTYVMTNDNLTSDGITDEGENSTPTARIKAVITRGDMTVASMNMPFGVSNLSHQPDLNSNQGATAVGSEVRNNLKENTDIGAIFRSINVNDMIRKGFVFLGNLAGAGGDNPINLMILPTQDPATFRIIAFVGANQRSSGEDEGLSVNFNSQDLAEDMSKFKKEMEELNKKKDDDEDSGGEGSMEFNFYGTIILEARVGIADGKWNIAFRGGNVGTNVKGKYEWGQTFFCGPYPAFISFEVGFHADLEVAFGNKSAVRAMLLDAALGVSIEAFAGLGFDLSIVAIQLGIYGQIGADVNFLLLTPSDAKASTGTKLTISGEIGIKLKVKLLFISYTEKFASTGFNWTKKWNNYDQIKQYWNNQGFGQLFGTTESGRAYTMYLFEDGSTMVAIEENGELESRDYLELAERAWLGGGSSAMRLMSADGMTDVQTNAYPYSHPAFTDDGEMFLYISDNNNSKSVDGVTVYSVKSGSSYAEGVRVDTENNVLADLDVVASGTSSNAFAAWVKQVETPKRADKTAAVTNDELGMMFNATEIFAGAYNGTAWTTTQLTDNNVADMAPAVASSGNRAIVAWRSLNASSMTDGDDLTAMFNVENSINYRIYNGSEWTTAQVAYNGSAGTVNAIDSAMLSDGTAILVYTVRTGEDVTSTETFYTVINASCETVTTGRLTNDSYTDANAQATAVNDPSGGYFVLGWYSEHDAGEGTTAAKYDADGNVTATKAVVAHDIRLARINANGSYDIDFPESIGGSADSGVTSDFRFSAPAGNTSLENLSVVWSQRKDSDLAADEGKYQLNAVRFFKVNGVTGLTVPTLIAETAKNYTIDRFDAYTDNSGTVHAIILGADYDNMVNGSVYDTIDLSKATTEVSSNNAEPAADTLTILDAEAISSLKLATGTFPATAADVTADINISEVIPGFTTPVQFTVTNTGTSPIYNVTATVGSQSKTFTGVNLLPSQSATLLMSYSVPEGAVSDANYSVTSSDATLGNGTLALNRPDVGISGIKLLQESEGNRVIQITLANSSNIPLAGSGKTVKLAFYQDPFHENMIGTAVTIPAADYADIDAGTYTTVQTVSVTDVAALVDGEIPEAGLTVYARAWVDETEEPNIYNNDNYVSVTGLLARNNGEKLTTDTSVEESNGSYTVYADIRNNSMQDTNVGTPVALLLDGEGKVIAQKNFQDEALTLTKEQSSSLSVAFTTEELNGETPVSAGIGYVYTVKFDATSNGGTGTFADATSDLDGHITLPEDKPTPPTGGAEQLFFAGWYTQATGGELITSETVFTEDTTVYAHYVNHQHVFTYSASGTTITATCANSDGFCYLDETDGKHTATLTLAATENNIYTGSAIGAILLDANGIQGDAKVLYATKGEGDTYGEASETVPVNVGAYKASITLGAGENAATVEVAYEIENATLTGVSAAQNGTLTYSGSAQTPQVTTAATAVNNQTVTFTYSLTETGEFGDLPTFTDVADSGTVYYKASAPNHNDSEVGSFTVTVSKSTPSAPAAPTADNVSASSVTLNAVEGCEYSKDGTNWQDSTLFTGLERLTEYDFYQRLAETDNTNASPASTAKIKTSDHDHNWGSFTVDGATISATCANTDTFHTGELTATMVISAPTLTIYGGTGSAEATVANDIAGIETPEIVYKKGDEVLGAAPTAAGTYTASITLNGVTASVEYTIQKAPLTVTANAKTVTYGDAPANDGVTYSGFVNSETEAVLGGTLDYDYSYTQYGDVGNAYTITPKGLTADNYEITFADGTLTVEQKEVGLSWGEHSFTYNGQTQKPAATATGLVNSDEIGVTVSGEQTNASATAYTATATGFTGEKAGNYKLPSAVTQTFTIGKAALTVTAKPKTITYGDAPANDGVEYEGFVNGETAAVLGGTLAYDYSYTQYGDVDDYSITPKGLTSGNYDITFTAGTLTVDQKVIGLDWTDLSFPYDGQPHKPTATPTGVVNNDAIEVPVFSAKTNVGTYTASAALTGAKAGNYMLPEVYTHSFEITQIAISGAIVQLAPCAYGTAVSTPAFVNDSSVTGANGTIVEGDGTKHVDYYYQATAFLASQIKDADAIAALADTDGVFTSETFDATTFDVGKHYVLAVVTGDNYNNAPYITQSVFEITQNTDTVRTAPTAPTVDGTTVTVAATDRGKTLEYSLDGQTWLPVTLDENGSFKAEWPNAVSGAALKLRETADANYSKPSAAAQGSQTVTTTTFTVTYDANGGLNAPDPVTVTTDKTVRVSAQSGMTRTGYTFDGWNTAANGSGTPYEAGDTLSTGMTLYAQWTENTYTVQFNANGGTGTMDKLQDVSYTEEKTLPANSFARTDYNFIGWSTSSSGSVMYSNGQKIKGLATGGTVTLYAVWAKDLYTLRGTIYENDGTTPVAGAEIKLKLGSTVVETKVSAADGTYNFTAAPPALYNIVATKDDVTKTELADLTENKTIDLIMPASKTSSILDVQGSNTPPAVVGGLEDVAADEEIDGRSIVVTMTVKAQSESENADAEEIGEVASGDTGVLLLEITVEKEIKRNGNVESTEAITDTGNTVVEIIVPYDFSGKDSVKVYRCHGDEPAEELEQSDTGADGTYKLDRTNGRIYIYASKFSTYAIGYKTYNYAPSTYKLTILDSEHGTVIADKTFPEEGAKVTLTVTPDEGYELDVITATDAYGNEITLTENEDGTYAFKQPDSKVTISSTFKETAQKFFVDVAEGSYYYDAVKWAVENEITNGVDETHFAPNASCTRAQMVTFLWRAAGKPEPTATATAFTDIDASAYYYKAVLWAYENGITLGTSTTTFSPGATVTRAQSVTFLFRALSGAAGTENPFEDVKDGTYYADAVKWAYENGITLGTSDTMFSPENDCLRAQIVTFLYRAYNEA